MHYIEIHNINSQYKNAVPFTELHFYIALFLFYLHLLCQIT